MLFLNTIKKLKLLILYFSIINHVFNWISSSWTIFQHFLFGKVRKLRLIASGHSRPTVTVLALTYVQRSRTRPPSLIPHCTTRAFFSFPNQVLEGGCNSRWLLATLCAKSEGWPLMKTNGPKKIGHEKSPALNKSLLLKTIPWKIYTRLRMYHN